MRHMEHQSRVEPTIRQVAVQKMQPTVVSRVRPLTTTNGICFMFYINELQLSEKVKNINYVM